MAEIGRPSLYRPEYCQKVLELGSVGMSVVEMAAEIGVSRNTMETLWPAAHPEFLEALGEARDRSQAWWENQGRLNLAADKFQTALYNRSMAARFPRDWRENKAIDHTSSDGTMTPRPAIDATKLSTEALREVVQAKNDAK